MEISSIQVQSTSGFGRSFLRIARYKHLATIAGLHTHRFAKCRFTGTKITTGRASVKAGAKITAWCSIFVTGSKV